MDTKQEQLEQALKNLSLNELEAVLDALVLVSEQYEINPPHGLYLVPPYGELIASGDMKCFAKPRHDTRFVGTFVLVSGTKAYGVISVGKPVQIDVDEFDSLFGDQHRVSRKDRLQWWPEKESLYLYPIDEFMPYAGIKEVNIPPGVQTYMESVPFSGNDGSSIPLRVSIATTQREAEKGFSGRKSIGHDEGILIPISSRTGIWMKDTYIPLTVAFLDGDYKVLQLTSLLPEDETIHVGPSGSKWALEASPSWFDGVGVEVGDTISGLPKQQE